MVGGVLCAVIGLMLGLEGGVAIWIGIGGSVVVFAIIAMATFGSVPRHQAALTSVFPADPPESR
jgi:hypothetical protein